MRETGRKRSSEFFSKYQDPRPASVLSNHTVVLKFPAKLSDFETKRCTRCRFCLQIPAWIEMLNHADAERTNKFSSEFITGLLDCRGIICLKH
ncbi:hypothetical protein GE061_003993 [Apolygus lucorum]|uniref:Uncharacterized protein n=1 Tax=Apolygus lucorum TaxID=248454 RepID=A0A8S9WZS7_APOLU|nr:hypothetical protein GE061_003993 [Apolygus lucorum]